MKILYISQYYPPEMGAPSVRVSQLARHWKAAGHQVTVQTGFPNHPTGKLHPEYVNRFRRGFHREELDGIDVVRSWLIPLPNRKPWQRILNYVSFCLSAAVRGTFLRRPDVVIATSPQLLVGLAGWWVHLIKRVPLVFEVRDIWPEGILASGVGREGTFFARSLRAVSRFLYRVSDRIVVVSPAYIDDLVRDYSVPRDKMSLVPNGVETDLFRRSEDRSIDTELGLEGRFVCSFIGTIGFAHGLSTVVEAATTIKDQLPDVVFLLVGEGSDKESLREAIASKGLDNVMLLDQQPFERVPQILSRSDVALVLLKRAPTFKTVIPTKMLECMACEVPVVLGVEGQAAELLAAADGGIAIAPEDPQALVDALARLHEDPELRRRYGSSGRDYVVNNLSRGATATTYIDFLAEVIGGDDGRS